MADTNDKQYQSDLAGYVQERFDRWKANRQDKQTKWEQNLEAYKASFDNHWKLPNVRTWEMPAFIRVTKQKVMAGFALVADVMMQGGKIPYQYKLSPWADDQLDQMPEEVADIEREQMKRAKAKADEQLQMTRSERSFAKNILSAALYGETVAKFMVKTIRRKRRKPMAVDGIGDLSTVSRNKLQYETVEVQKIAPAWGYISIWDFFYDEEGGVYDGRGCIHRRLVNNGFLRGRMKKPGFIEAAIKRVIDESKSDDYDFQVDTSSLAPSLRNITNRENTRQYLEYWGRIPRKCVEEFEKTLKELAKKGEAGEPLASLEDLGGYENDGDEIECCVHVVDNQVVFFARTNQEDRPFEHTYWEDPLDELAGSGVADNVSDMQRLINDVFRDYQRNKKLAGNIKGIIKRRMLDEDVKDEDFETPGKNFEASEDCTDARQAYQQISVQDVGGSLQPLLQLAFQILDEDSMIARIMQGGEPEGDVTAKQIMEQTEKGGKYIATIVQNFDERLIEPMMNRFFDYNMSDPENMQGRGDFVAEALGFTSFMDKQVRVRYLTTIFSYILQSEVLQKKYDVTSVFDEIIKSLDADPTQFERSQDELDKLNQPDPLQQLEIESKKAQIEKDNSATRLNDAKVEQTKNEDKLKRAEFVQGHIDRKKKEVGSEAE